MKTQAALAAKQIREILKKELPNIKFKVTSENYSMDDSINVSYENGVPTERVEKLISQYQYGHFDGMQDMYENSNRRDDIPQTKYLFVRREISPEIRATVKTMIAKRFVMVNENDEQEWMAKMNSWSDQVIWREIRDLNIEGGVINYRDSIISIIDKQLSRLD